MATPFLPSETHKVARETSLVGTDDESLAHWVWPADDLLRSYVTGEPVMALCGKRWVPQHDPAPLPICEPCAQAKSEILNR